MGVFNTLVGLGVIYSCKYFLGASDVSANIAGYATGLMVSFVLHSSWTFEYRGPRWQAFGRFVLVFAVSWLANLLAVMAAIHLLGLNSYLSQAAGVPAYTLCFYLLSRSYAFRQ